MEFKDPEFIYYRLKFSYLLFTFFLFLLNLHVFFLHGTKNNFGSHITIKADH